MKGMKPEEIQVYLRHILSANEALNNEIQSNLNTVAEKFRKFKDGDLCKLKGVKVPWRYEIAGISRVDILQSPDGMVTHSVHYNTIEIDSRGICRPSYGSAEEHLMCLAKKEKGKTT